jgi:hypothetical protein
MNHDPDRCVVANPSPRTPLMVWRALKRERGEYAPEDDGRAREAWLADMKQHDGLSYQEVAEVRAFLRRSP